MSDEKIFAKGFSFKRSENAPDFVIGRVSIKVDDAIAFMKEHQKDGWINLDTKQARSGSYYMELDQYDAKKAGNSKPKPQAQKNEQEEMPFGGGIDDGDLPF